MGKVTRNSLKATLDSPFWKVLQYMSHNGRCSEQHAFQKPAIGSLIVDGKRAVAGRFGGDDSDDLTGLYPRDDAIFLDGFER